MNKNIYKKNKKILSLHQPTIQESNQNYPQFYKNNITKKKKKTPYNFAPLHTNKNNTVINKSSCVVG